MKLSDIPEIQEIGQRLEAIRKLQGWLDTFSTDGLRLDANGVLGQITLSRTTSRSLLDDAEKNCLDRLKELGVEE